MLHLGKRKKILWHKYRMVRHGLEAEQNRKQGGLVDRQGRLTRSVRGEPLRGVWTERSGVGVRSQGCLDCF